MSRALKIFLASLLTFSTQSMAIEHLGKQCSLDFSSQMSNSGESNVTFVNSRFIIEKVTGKRAQEHFLRVQKAHPERFKQAGQRLKALGYKPTQEVVVFRAIDITKIDLGKYRPNQSFVMPAQDSYSNSDGEVVFWAWDDGADWTWEGVTAVERYSDGASATYESQLDISTENYWTVWERTTSYDPGDTGGGGGGHDGPAPIQSRFEGTPSELAKIASADLNFVLRLQDSNAVMPAQTLGRWQRFINCALSLCGACNTACRSSGIGWGGCFGRCCPTTTTFCAVTELL